MANRRMFSLQIVDSDAFLDMPPSSQLLYFHLSMRADDDGFVSNPKKILRSIGSQDDDLKVLLTKRFILAFESGVIVIKHWRMHNLIRSDRYNETQYIEEKNTLYIKENGSYTELHTKCLPDGNRLATQVRLGKVSIGKINTMQPKTVALSDSTKREKKNPNAKIPDWNKYLEAMDNHPARHVNIIAHYFREKGLFYETYGKVDTAIKRHLRAAKALAPFSDEEISKATDQAKNEYPDLWTVETITKLLSR